MKELFLGFIFFIGITPIIRSQDTASFQEPEARHLLTVSFGYTFIPKGTSIGGTEPNGVFVPSIGLDYFYKIAPKWEIGVMIDLELEEYLVFHKDLEREKAMLFALVGSYKLTKEINLFAGGGIELERNHNLGIIRFGAEYVINFNHGWLLAPGFFYDIKEGYDTWSLAIAFGKEF